MIQFVLYLNSIGLKNLDAQKQYYYLDILEN